ncbi:MAG: hypothetical protein AAB517_02390 [Patescibacteria group bacterium]
MSTLTVYPDAGYPGTTTCDGNISIATATWAGSRDATAGNSVTVDSPANILMQARLDAVPEYLVTRGFFLVDASALTSAANISAATWSFAANGAVFSNADLSTIHLVSSTPASNTTLVIGDFDQIGSTSFSSLAMASWVNTDHTYNDFALNANGIANISKTGVSKFAARNSRDLDNSAPTGNNICSCYFADQAGTTDDPKLVITYTLPGVPSGFFMMM